jgi:hypothetical protein
MRSVSLRGFPGTDEAVPQRHARIGSNPLSQASHHPCALFALGANRACTPGSTTQIYLIANDSCTSATHVSTSFAHYFRFGTKFDTNRRH